jgi:hypothetical protein
MTCIISTARYMCADRRIKDETGERSTMCKIAKNAHLIAALAGTAACALAIKQAIRDGASTPQDLLVLVDNDSHALVLEPSGARWRIEEGVLWPVSAGLSTAAIGTGANAALGYIAGALRGTRRAPPAWLARAAQRFAAKLRDDCGDGVDFRSFD